MEAQLEDMLTTLRLDIILSSNPPGDDNPTKDDDDYSTFQSVSPSDHDDHVPEVSPILTDETLPETTASDDQMNLHLQNHLQLLHSTRARRPPTRLDDFVSATEVTDLEGEEM